MILGIDASNIRQGGGVTHLVEILKEYDPYKHDFKKIVIWSCKNTLDKIPDNPNIQKIYSKYIEKGTLTTFYFQVFQIKKELEFYSCDIVFVPGGTFLSKFKPYVTMSQNMLPFELKEAFRYKNLLKKLKFILLFITQSYTFKNAKGVIFLTNYAKNIINQKIPNLINSIIIPHGINKLYSTNPKKQIESSSFNNFTKFNLLYVSILSPYKHQTNLVKSVCELNELGYPIKLTLIGPSEKQSLNEFKKTLSLYSNHGSCVNYLGSIDHKELFKFYRESDAFIFASTCENLPIILIEAMSSGLPILCSNYGPMQEVLGQNENMYFDPLNLDNIKEKIVQLFESCTLREKISNESFLRSLKYSWSDVADLTFKYLFENIRK